jgi:hypothetical protein
MGDAPCFRPAKVGEQSAKCPWKGRRGPEARSRVAAFVVELEVLRRDLAADADAPEVLELTQATRYLEGQLILKFAWLSQLPWRLWEVHDADSASSVILDFDAQEARDPSRAHRISRRMLSESTELGRAMRAFARGEPMSAELHRELWAYKLARLDESAVEGIHRDVRDIVQQSRSPPAWWASSLRLRENLAAWQACQRPGGQVYFLRAFANWTCVVQPRPREAALLRPCRVKARDAREFMYRLRMVALKDWGPLGAFVSAALPPQPMGRLSALRALQADWLQAAFRNGSWIAVPEPGLGGHEGDIQVRVLLTLDNAPSSKKTLGPKSGSGLAVPAVVQIFDPIILERWPVEEFEVVPAGEPAVMDLMDVAPFALLRRESLVCEVAGVSDLLGATRLRVAGPVGEVCFPGEDADVPAIELLDRLRSRGWALGRQAPALLHSDGFVDSRGQDKLFRVRHVWATYLPLCWDAYPWKG